LGQIHRELLPMPPDEPAAIVVAHRCEGRVRLRFADGTKDLLTLAGLAVGLRELKGVVTVEARAQTGSVILKYSGDFGAIAEEAAFRQICIVIDSPMPEEPRRATPTPSPSVLGAAGFAALACLQLYRGHALPPAITLLWYAAGLLGREMPGLRDLGADSTPHGNGL
jgi:hypothetical protein